MIPNEILLLVVAAIAFYIGYRMGRMSVLAERGGSAGAPAPEMADAGVLPGPEEPARPRSAAPPASAGGEAAPGRTVPPRRSSAPPPARAGLLDPGSGKGKS